MTTRPADDRPTDVDLILRLQQRDDQALGDLYDRYAGLAYALAYRMLGERGQAEDVVQEAFLSVWRAAARFDPERGSVRSWLLTIVRNAAIDRRRGRFRHQQEERAIDDFSFRLAGPADEVWHDVHRTLDRESVHRALGALPPEQRQTIELAYFGGLTQEEIAEKVGIPLGTVKGRARLGLRKLEEHLRSTSVKNENDDV